MKSDFQMMTMRELKKYVLEHRNDQAAFQALMDRVDAQPQNKVYGEVDAEYFFPYYLNSIAASRKINIFAPSHPYIAQSWL